MPKIVMVYDLPADPNNPNGPTIREENYKLAHNIPVGTLVEVKYDNWHGDGCCQKVHARLWVFSHMRNCDGTPLYVLADITKDQYHKTCESMSIQPEDIMSKRLILNVFETGFSESSLKPVEVTEELKKGYGALEWTDEEK